MPDRASSDEQFFIVGCPRSGTTLLQVALNRHSQVLIPPETKFFFYCDGMPRWLRRRHLPRLQNDLQIELSQEPPGAGAESRTAYLELFQRYRDRIGKASATHLGDKTPEHTGRLASIRRAFPTAPVIFVYRDGRDVACSLSRVPWLHCDAYAGAAVWLRYYRDLQFWRARSDPYMTFVRYEDLVSQPQLVLTQLQTFLGLPVEAAVWQGQGDPVGAIPEREFPWKEPALGPISTEYVGRWRQMLSPREADDLQVLLRPALLDLEYDVPPAAVRPGLRLRLRTASSVVRMVCSLPFDGLWAELAGRRIDRRDRRRLPSPPHAHCSRPLRDCLRA